MVRLGKEVCVCGGSSKLCLLPFLVYLNSLSFIHLYFFCLFKIVSFISSPSFIKGGRQDHKTKTCDAWRRRSNFQVPLA